MIRSKENVSEVAEKCSALEIECVPFQSNSFAILPIQNEKLKQNSSVHQNVPHDVFFVPVNTSDPTHVVVKRVNKTTHDLDHLYDFNWPWSVEIFINGDLTTNGILMDKSWILVDKNIFGNSHEPLHENHVVAVVGNTKTHLNIQSPYEQFSKVDCLQYVNESNVILLHVEKPFNLNRQVLPSFLPIG
jgi:hypothetical protein